MTSTEVVRRFGDVLAAVKHGGETVVVTKNGEPVADIAFGVAAVALPQHIVMALPPWSVANFRHDCVYLLASFVETEKQIQRAEVEAKIPQLRQ